MKKAGFITLYVLLTTVFLSGCATLIKSEKDTLPQGPIEPQANLKLSDVPVPVGFRLIPKDSYSFESAGIRVALLKYQGKANPDQLVNFFKEQMMMYNWNLLNAIEYGERMLNFDRDNETCIVNLTPKGNNAVIITISIGPKAQKIPKKSEKPLK